jgi:anti-anti-sigma factor
MAKMSRSTKFVGYGSPDDSQKNYENFMVSKPRDSRLSTSMQTNDAVGQMSQQRQEALVFPALKESQLKLSLETRNCGDVIIVHCQGRIVYRDEAAALSRVVGEVMQQTGNVVLDLTGVTSMDSAGIGELALLQTWAQEKNASLKCAGANSLVRTLLDLTNLDSVIEVHPSLDAALESFREERVCADC